MYVMPTRGRIFSTPSARQTTNHSKYMPGHISTERQKYNPFTIHISFTAYRYCVNAVVKHFEGCLSTIGLSIV